MENNFSANEINRGSKNMENQFRATVDQLKESATHMKDEIGKVGSIARETATEQFSEISKLSSEKIDEFAKYVKDRPLTSLAIVGALGYFLGTFSRR